MKFSELDLYTKNEAYMSADFDDFKDNYTNSIVKKYFLELASFCEKVYGCCLITDDDFSIKYTVKDKNMLLDRISESCPQKHFVHNLNFEIFQDAPSELPYIVCINKKNFSKLAPVSKELNNKLHYILANIQQKIQDKIMEVYETISIYDPSFDADIDEYLESENLEATEDGELYKKISQSLKC